MHKNEPLSKKSGIWGSLYYVKFLELEIFKYNKLFNYKVKKIELIYDYFNNPYVYVNFNPCGYMIVSLINNESVIIDPFGFEYNKNDGF
ncbi:Uncharacterised protein [Chlamydia abortus]|nr:Uncharacterised protein [Chlamydia abortus]